MLNLILAVEEIASESAGDDLATLSYALLIFVMVVAAITTLVITPSAEDLH